MKWLSLIWRWSLVVTLPIAGIFAVWAPATLSRWWDFGVRHLTIENYSLLNVGKLEIDHLKRVGNVTSQQMALETALEESGLQPMQLFISKSSLAELGQFLPDSGYEYKKASLAYNGGLQKVKVRWRGDSSYHWGYWKKSWRIKTSQDQLFDGMRKFNWVAPRTPELFNNHLGHRLADRMGLIAPKSEVVPVFVNGDFEGIYAQTEQMEELTLRRSGRMPGDIYAGDIAGRDLFTAMDVQLFDHPGVWRKIAINNHFDDDARDPLTRFLLLIRDYKSPQAQRELSELLDMRQFAAFSAYESLAGTVHYDYTHNWRLYYDPWETKFVPLVWDPVAWHKSWRPKRGGAPRFDVISSPLHLALFHNADFLREREIAFREFYETGRAEAFLTEVQQTRKAVDPLLDHDRNMVSSMQVLEPEQIRSGLSSLEKAIESLFAQQREHHVGVRESSVELEELGPGKWALNVAGRLQVGSLELVMDAPIHGPLDAALSWIAQGHEHKSEIGGSLQVAGDTLTVGVRLISRHEINAPSMVIAETPKNSMSTSPGYYVLEVSGLPEGLSLTSARANFLDGTAKACGKVTGLQPVDMGLIQQLVPSNPLKSPTRWSGEIRLDGLLEVDDLVIDPGTTVLCTPGSSLWVKGRLIAEGSADAPIRFVPELAKQEPWGAVTLEGEGANGSQLAHCQFTGGSGWKEALAEYSAMVSVHSVQDVRFEHCLFQSSKIVDDMVHGVYSDILFSNCTFKDSLEDALDMDISVVQLVSCTFIGSGNDALDLMTTTASVVDTRFIDSGDKGISVGERSRLLILDSLIQGCKFGIQAKDDSVVLGINVDFVGNRDSAFDAYKKNWRYNSGGFGKLVNCWLSGPGASITCDKHSRIQVEGSFLEAEISPDVKGEALLGKDVLHGSPGPGKRKAKSFHMGNSLQEWGLDQAFFVRHAERLRVDSRGRGAQTK